MAFPTSSYYEVLSKTVVGPGVQMYVGAFTFAGTNPTYTFVSPSSNVISCVCDGTPTNIVEASRADSFVVNNTRGTSGYLTTLSTTTNSADPVISITREGTNSQDAYFTILARG